MRQLRDQTTLTVVTGLLFLQNLGTRGEVRPHPISKMPGMVQTLGIEDLTVEVMH